ncbi:MAG: hypothetical protein Q9187_005964 [Circinaria calcarea]
MDLVAGVRKEGSRGGRAEFKWEDVKDDQHRENYLGHSLMAPVGRWQKNKDLSWYAKGDDSQAAQDAAKARAEEIKRIKEAEQDALSAALGFTVEPRIRDNQLAGPKEVEKAIRETGEDEEEGGKGVGFGAYVGPAKAEADTSERLMGYVGEKGGLEGGAAKRAKRRADTSRERESRGPVVAAIRQILNGETDTAIEEMTGGDEERISLHISRQDPWLPLIGKEFLDILA